MNFKDFMVQLKEHLSKPNPVFDPRFPVAGSTDEEIEQLRIAQNVKRLPQAYIDFIKTLGNGGGNMFKGITIEWDRLLDIKSETEGLREEFGFDLPSDAFVFEARYDYLIYFHTDNEEDNPICYRFLVDDDENPRELGRFQEYLQSRYEQHLDDITRILRYRMAIYKNAIEKRKRQDTNERENKE